ncbi:hypothetical protein OFN62_34265, partial [Escherichia coli]|nr:hypothetical protein [Escherichia coli]
MFERQVTTNGLKTTHIFHSKVSRLVFSINNLFVGAGLRFWICAVANHFLFLIGTLCASDSLCLIELI